MQYCARPDFLSFLIEHHSCTNRGAEEKLPRSLKKISKIRIFLGATGIILEKLDIFGLRRGIIWVKQFFLALITSTTTSF